MKVFNVSRLTLFSEGIKFLSGFKIISEGFIFCLLFRPFIYPNGSSEGFDGFTEVLSVFTEVLSVFTEVFTGFCGLLITVLPCIRSLLYMSGST
jgi:hypothetical protein